LEKDGADSELYQVVGFGISSIESMSFGTTALVC